MASSSAAAAAVPVVPRLANLLSGEKAAIPVLTRDQRIEACQNHYDRSGYLTNMFAPQPPQRAFSYLLTSPNKRPSTGVIDEHVTGTGGEHITGTGAAEAIRSFDLQPWSGDPRVNNGTARYYCLLYCYHTSMIGDINPSIEIDQTINTNGVFSTAQSSNSTSILNLWSIIINRFGFGVNMKADKQKPLTAYKDSKDAAQREIYYCFVVPVVIQLFHDLTWPICLEAADINTILQTNPKAFASTFIRKVGRAGVFSEGYILDSMSPATPSPAPVIGDSKWLRAGNLKVAVILGLVHQKVYSSVVRKSRGKQYVLADELQAIGKPHGAPRLQVFPIFDSSTTFHAP